MRALAFLAALALSLAAATSQAGIAPPPDGRPIVIGQSYTLDSKILGQARRINVWLPADYATSSRTYPVLILLDGGEDEDFHTITGLASLGAY
ncbi:esterase, partial [Pseudomonas sp. FW215-L2]|uniref:alpha/beta hydrolase-fold protein n=1 Tax=Pseudomonas sp. FW215-L2 TaxID=2070573 RepID=UPI000CBA9067